MKGGVFGLLNSVKWKKVAISFQMELLKACVMTVSGSYLSLTMWYCLSSVSRARWTKIEYRSDLELGCGTNCSDCVGLHGAWIFK